MGGKNGRKGVSPVPAELLLLALVVVGGVIVYIFVSGLGGSLTKSGSQQLTTDLSLDAYTFPASGPLTMTIRDVGTTNATIQAVYYNGTPVLNPGCLGTLTHDSTVQSSFTPSPLPAQGTSVQVNVATAGGAVYHFNVIVGGAS